MSTFFKRKFSYCKTLLLLFSLFLASCKSGYDEYWPKENPKGGFIYNRVKDDPRFSIFAQALDRSGLVKYVNVAGLYTVFAPTNDAFAKFFAAKGYSSIEDVPVADLFSIINYHIANNMWYYYNLKTRYAATKQTNYITRNNKFLVIDVTTPNVLKVNGISVIEELRDIDAENGVLHGIDEVLIPLPNVEQVLESNTLLAGNTFYQTMQLFASRAYDRFNSNDLDRDGLIDSIFYKTYPLLQGVQTSLEYTVNSLPTSQGGDPVFTTVLLPSNEKLSATLQPVLDKFQLSEIKDLPVPYLEALLESHFYISNTTKLSSADLSSGKIYTSINGDTIPKLAADQILIKDIAASNGTVHVINSVLPSRRLRSAIGNIMTEPDMTDFIYALHATDLLASYAVLNKAATYLVPTNEALLNAGLDVRKRTLNGSPLTVAQLTNILKHHVINSFLIRTALTGTKTTDLANHSLTFSTINGELSVTSSGKQVAQIGVEYRGPSGSGIANATVYKINTLLIPSSY